MIEFGNDVRDERRFSFSILRHRKARYLSYIPIKADPSDTETEFAQVRQTHIGKSVYSVRPYPEMSIIGEITGRVFEDVSAADSYTFDFENDLMLQPMAPFRFLNHSCDPNCNFEIIEQPASRGQAETRALFLCALRDIAGGEELTIDYNWPASSAIKCECRTDDCRGWVVSVDELPLLVGTPA